MKGSMDCQKCIQGLTRYSVKTFATMDGVNANDSIFGESICVGDPAVTIVAVEHMVFLAVIQVSSIRASNADLQHIPVSILSEDSMLVGFHILTLKSTMLREGDEDWIWACWDLEHAGGKTKGNTSNLSVLLCGWTRMWDALCLYSPRPNYRSSLHHWWQPLVSKGYLNLLGSVELHLSLIAVQKVSLSVYWMCWTNIPKGGQACFVAELSSDERALSNLDETHTCSHCNT